MTNAKLIERARRYAELKRTEKAAKADAAVESTAVLAELERRKVSEVVHDGVTVSRRQGNLAEVDPKALRARLTRSVVGRVIGWKVDREVLKAEVKAGRVDQADVDACTTFTPKAAYIDVDDGRVDAVSG